MRNNRQKKWLVIMFTLFVVGWANAGMARAADDKPLIDDVRVLVDISGSMKVTDPSNARIPSTRLLSNLVPEGSRLGILTFGSKVDSLFESPDVDKKARMNAHQSLSAITSKAQWTNIELALENILSNWNEADPHSRRSLILLTDGLVDVDVDPINNEESRNRIIKNLIPRLNEMGVHVYGLALSSKADRELLKILSEKTSGFYQQVENSAQLEKSFLTVFEASAPHDQLSLKNNSFNVDKDSQEITLVLFHRGNQSPIKIKTPDGREVSEKNKDANMLWHSEENYDLITVQQPKEGHWQPLVMSDSQHRVFVGTHLQLRANELPKQIFACESLDITAKLVDHDVVVRDQSVLDLLLFQLSIVSTKNNGQINNFLLRDNGVDADQKSKDGVYSYRWQLDPKWVGAQEIILKVKGDTFSRDNKQIVQVQPCPINVTHDIVKDSGGLLVNAVVNTHLFDQKSLVVIANVTNPKGEIEKYHLDIESKEEFWRFALKHFPGEYSYQLDFTLDGKTLNGRQVHIILPTIKVGSAVKPEVAEKTSVNSIDEKAAIHQREAEIEVNKNNSLHSEKEAVKDSLDNEKSHDKTIFLFCAIAAVFLAFILLILVLYLVWQRIQRGTKRLF